MEGEEEAGVNILPFPQIFIGEIFFTGRLLGKRFEKLTPTEVMW